MIRKLLKLDELMFYVFLLGRMDKQRGGDPVKWAGIKVGLNDRENHLKQPTIIPSYLHISTLDGAVVTSCLKT